MELEEVTTLLNGCERRELRDHAFGDVEVFWMKNGQSVAGGYFGGGHADVWLNQDVYPDQPTYKGLTARELWKCGTEGRITRNDETGPDEFVEGYTMPGLTLEGVLKELTTPPDD